MGWWLPVCVLLVRTLRVVSACGVCILQIGRHPTRYRTGGSKDVQKSAANLRVATAVATRFRNHA